MIDQSLANFGWTDFFDRQLTADDTGTPARVSTVHRERLDALTPDGPVNLLLAENAGLYATGDWVLHDGDRVTRRLDRKTEISRRAAGETALRQLIAANVDTLGIVTSCNADFNVARLERYLALAESSGCLPLVVLTKADLADDPANYRKQAEKLSPLLAVLTLDARDPEEATRLSPWCRDGQTLALVGSSGVGKTTLQNALTGIDAATRDIREDDAKGRHTTTARSLRPTLGGGWLIDTPGMRELRLTDAAEGISAVFSDIEDLALRCRFSDCRHDTEPGCAVRAAVANGEIDADRLARWQKLRLEDQYNSETVAQARARYRRLGRMYSQGKTRGDHKRGDA